jgi:RDD family
MFCSRCGAASAAEANFCRHCGVRLNLATQDTSITERSAPITESVSTSVPRQLPVTSRPAYAGFSARASSSLIDWFILSGVAFALSFFVAFVNALTESVEPNGLEAILALMCLAGAWLYYAAMDSSQYQGTVGKQLMGIQLSPYRASAFHSVVQARGSSADFYRG